MDCSSQAIHFYLYPLFLIQIIQSLNDMSSAAKVKQNIDAVKQNIATAILDASNRNKRKNKTFKLPF